MAKRDLTNIRPYRTPAGETRYQVQVRTSGRRVSRSFASLREAQRWRDQVKATRPQAQRASRPGVGLERPASVIALINEWWRREVVAQAPGERPRLKESSRQSYRNALRRWVEGDPLGELAPDTVHAEHVIAWQERCRRRGAGADVIRQAQKALSSAFEWGVRHDLTTGITRNPVRAAGWPAIARRHRPVAFHPRVCEHLRQRILRGPGEERLRRRDALLLSAMYQTGARPHELLAVQMHDIGERTIALPQTKTDVPRTVELLPTLREEVEAFARDFALSRDDYLIARLDGLPLARTSLAEWRRRAFIPARDAVIAAARSPDPRLRAISDTRLAGQRPYDVGRHSFAALLLASGRPLAEVAALLGHSLDTLAAHYHGQIMELAGAGKVDPAEVIRAARAEVAEVLN